MLLMSTPKVRSLVFFDGDKSTPRPVPSGVSSVAAVWIPDEPSRKGFVQAGLYGTDRASGSGWFTRAVPTSADQFRSASYVFSQSREFGDSVRQFVLERFQHRDDLVAGFLAAVTHLARQRDRLDTLHSHTDLRQRLHDACALDVVLGIKPRASRSTLGLN